MLVPLLAAALAAVSPRAEAFDGSGGRRVADLLGRIEYQRIATPWLSPVVADFDEPGRRLFEGRLERVLREMPLDVAQLGPVSRIVVSDSRAACSTPVYAELRRSGPGLAKVLIQLSCTQAAGWDPKSKELLLSGEIVLEKVRYGDGPETDALPSAVLHELVHAWEDEHRDAAGPFYALRYERLARAWSRVRERYARWEKKREAARKAGKPVTASRGDDLELIDALEQARYASLALPARRDSASKPSDGALDTHPMDEPGEYLASLAQLLWVDPDWAVRQWSRPEIDWIEANLFGGRLTTRAAAVEPELRGRVLEGLEGARRSLSR